MNVTLIIFVVLVVAAMLCISFRAIFYAFIKKKDERSKLIVVKSMAGSFVVTVILQSILLCIKMINYDFYEIWWSSFKKGVYIEPVLLSFIILGIILIINTKKYGGSL